MAISRRLAAFLLGIMCVQLGGVAPGAAANTVYADAAGLCDGLTPCFTTIQAAVNNAGPGDSNVFVFPATYAESVNLSTMGSAIAALPGALIILNSAFIGFIATEEGSGEPTVSGPAFVTERLEPARAALAASRAALVELLTEPGEPLAATAGIAPEIVPFNIAPAAGPALYHTGTFPSATIDGSVALAGATVKSVDASAILLPDVAASITMIAVTADDNAAGSGFDLIAGDDIALFAVTASRNGVFGINAQAASGIQMSGAQANDNMQAGMRLLAGLDITIFGDLNILFPIPVTGFGPTAASDNGADGINAQAGGGIAVVASLDFDEPTVILNNGNGAQGLDLNADEGLTVFGVQSNGNLSGMSLVTMTLDMLVFGASAIGNTGGPGIAANTPSMGGGEPPFADIGIHIVSVNASENSGPGFDLTAPNSSVLVWDSTAFMNTDGVRLNALDTGVLGRTQVYGNILCGNSASGLRLLANTGISAQGNWWGDPSGPLHPNNPAGLGNPVIDSSNGGNGAANFSPWIDTIMVGVPAVVNANQSVDVRFQFSGGSGTVFLGLPPPFMTFAFFQPDPPFIVTTNNGQLTSEFDTGEVVPAAINRPEGVASVDLTQTVPGAAILTIDGPCNLDAVTQISVIGSRGAPAVSLWALAALCLALAGIGTVLLQRRAQASR